MHQIATNAQTFSTNFWNEEALQMNVDKQNEK